MPASNSVPTLTIGGFLGAGKTTLVNHLLTQADGKRVVVFVNDFGAINIDHDLIETVEEDRIALSNGCVCCSLNDDLLRAMVTFCENDRPDLFAIEASGVADPKALSATLQTLQQAGQAHLQCRIYVMDAAQFGGLDYADSEDLIDHAAASDLILINKSDLVPKSRIEEIAQLLARSAPNARRRTTSQAELSWADALALHSRSPWENVGQVSRHDVNSRFTTAAFKNVPPLSKTRLDAVIDLMKDTCLRAKGSLRVDDPQPLGCRIQLVGRHVDLTTVPEGEDLLPQLVVIGWSSRLVTSEFSELLGADAVISP